MATTDQAERQAAIERGRAGNCADITTPCIRKKLVLEARCRDRLHADNAVLGLEVDDHILGKITGDHGRQPDAQVDQVARFAIPWRHVWR